MKRSTALVIFFLFLLVVLFAFLKFQVVPTWNARIAREQAEAVPSSSQSPTPSPMSHLDQVLSTLTPRQKILQLTVFSYKPSSSSAQLQWIMANNPGVVDLGVVDSKKAASLSALIKQSIATSSAVTPLFVTNHAFANMSAPVTTEVEAEQILENHTFVLWGTSLKNIDEVTSQLTELSATSAAFRTTIDGGVRQLLQQKLAQ